VLLCIKCKRDRYRQVCKAVTTVGGLTICCLTSVLDHSDLSRSSHTSHHCCNDINYNWNLLWTGLISACALVLISIRCAQVHKENTQIKNDQIMLKITRMRQRRLFLEVQY